MSSRQSPPSASFRSPASCAEPTKSHPAAPRATARAACISALIWPNALSIGTAHPNSDAS
eukprot:scaffold16881_cov73-Isochrysis_galbana.AAC.1